jgi:hypothetical protein
MPTAVDTLASGLGPRDHRIQHVKLQRLAAAPHGRGYRSVVAATDLSSARLDLNRLAQPAVAREWQLARRRHLSRRVPPGREPRAIPR